MGILFLSAAGLDLLIESELAAIVRRKRRGKERKRKGRIMFWVCPIQDLSPLRNENRYPIFFFGTWVPSSRINIVSKHTNA
jgi:hypothetical protein